MLELSAHRYKLDNTQKITGSDSGEPKELLRP